MENIREAIEGLMNKRKLPTQSMKTVYQDPEVVAFCQTHQAELTTEALERGAAKLYEFVNERRKIARHEPSFLPGYEPQLVLSNHLIDIEYVPTKEMTMRRQAAQRQALVKSISMPKMIRRADLVITTKSLTGILL